MKEKRMVRLHLIKKAQECVYVYTNVLLGAKDQSNTLFCAYIFLCPSKLTKVHPGSQLSLPPVQPAKPQSLAAVCRIITTAVSFL